MSNKIYGDNETINRARNASAGDPHVYVNMDAINELPDQYEVHIEKVRFDFKKDFDSVGNGNYMPSPAVMNAIADARGIEGTSDIQVSSIAETVDINPMLCLPIGSEPTMRHIIVGKRVIKQGRVLNEDGTWRVSDPCSVDYNVWDRCLIDWMKEEEDTNGYDKNLCLNGPFEYYKKQINGPYYKKGQYCYPIKYDTKWKRQSHFATQMKFAQRIADTKARHVVIRVLAGLKTGYQEGELKDGYFIFAKIRRSREILKLETAADLQARSKGLTAQSEQAQSMLFGPQEQTIEPVDEWPTDIIDQTPVPELRHMLIKVFEEYRKNNFIQDSKVDTVSSAISWLDKTVDAEKNEKFWNRAVDILKDIEQSIPEAMRAKHSFY